MKAAILQLRSTLEARFDSPLEIRKPLQKQQLPTGIPAIDRLTSGGIPRGSLTEICGAASSGRTALIVSLLSHTTQREECCVWIDSSGAFDPQSAADMGVDLDRLLWINCDGNAEHALKAADLLSQSGGFGLIIMDLADTSEREARRIPLAAWFRLRHAAERNGTALVLVARKINAGSCSTLQIELTSKGPVWRGKLLAGTETTAESRKHYRSRKAEFRAVR